MTAAMEAWIWLTAALALAAGEAAALGSLVCVFFALGAAATAAARAAGLVPELWQQSLLCLGCSAAGLLGLRGRLRRRRTGSAAAARLGDDLVGAEAEISGSLPAGGRGAAMLRGVPWQAQNIGSTALAAGQRGIVRRVVGLTLEVEASEREQAR